MHCCFVRVSIFLFFLFFFSRNKKEHLSLTKISTEKIVGDKQNHEPTKMASTNPSATSMKYEAMHYEEKSEKKPRIGEALVKARV